jgi:hypothetical protein
MEPAPSRVLLPGGGAGSGAACTLGKSAKQASSSGMRSKPHIEFRIFIFIRVDSFFFPLS